MGDKKYTVTISKLNNDVAQSIEEKLKDSGGYCPCKLVRNEDTKCMCKEFKDVVENMKKSNVDNLVSYCHCGLYAVTCKRV